MNSRLSRLVTGLDFRQEYLCLGLEEFRNPLGVFLTAHNSERWLNVTSQHLFLGYKPLVMAVTFSADPEGLSQEAMICLSFHQHTFSIDSRWKTFSSNRGSVARIILRRVEEKKLDDQKIIFYRGEWGEHKFLHYSHQLLNNWRTLAKRKASGNVDLPGNLYDQVRIAYSVPRAISLASLDYENQMNLFPTDLHGPVGEKFYISSLRIGGKACEQVERRVKIVISSIDSAGYKIAYELGKNHMKDLTGRENFDLLPRSSSVFKFPLSVMTGHYRELEWFEFFDIGIHRIFLYRVVNQETICVATTLAHIQCYYAQWRKNNQLPAEYLFR